MQSDFEPKHLKKAKEKLSEDLMAAKHYGTANRQPASEKPSLWKKLLSFLRRVNPNRGQSN